jgi:CBS domain-containing protein
MNTINDLLKLRKNESPAAVKPDTPVKGVISLMGEHNLEVVLVLDGADFFGLFSEKDILRKRIFFEQTFSNIPVCEIIEKNFCYVTPNFSLKDTLKLMTRKNIRHLPVLENGKYRGILFIEEVAHAVLEDQDYTIEGLTQYIVGWPTYNFLDGSEKEVKGLIWQSPKFEKYSKQVA